MVGQDTQRRVLRDRQAMLPQRRIHQPALRVLCHFEPVTDSMNEIPGLFRRSTHVVSSFRLQGIGKFSAELVMIRGVGEIDRIPLT